MTRSLYDSPRLAAAYAHDRPPVHRHVVRAVAARLARMRGPIRAALDIGCGAGLSTSALEGLADVRVGLEPVLTMLERHEEVAPGAHFAAGRAEHLPFASGAFDLLSAAGALNYADLRLALPEAARVLSPGGILVIYDFSGGRRLRDDQRLEEWFADFERRHPYPPGYSMEVRNLDLGWAGLRLAAYDDLEVAIPMSPDGYLAYVMSETNIEREIAGGASERGLRESLRRSLAPIFEAGPREVLFDAYAAYLTRSP